MLKDDFELVSFILFKHVFDTGSFLDEIFHKSQPLIYVFEGTLSKDFNYFSWWEAFLFLDCVVK